MRKQKKDYLPYLGSKEDVLVLKDIHKTYDLGKRKVKALNGISLSVQRGDFISIMGPSGSGKTTILNLLGALDTPTAGTITIGQRETGGLTPTMLADFRNTHLGFVFQTFNLIPVLTVLENVELPLQLHGIAEKEERITRIRRILEEVGLGDLADR